MPRTSNKQEEILQYIDRFVAENGYPPSVREIGAAVGLRSTASVSYHLNHLQAKGLVAYEAGKKRALSMPNAKPGQIPIIGVVTAGLPILAVENQEGTMSWDGDPGCFALRVRGDSMVGAAILDGDLVVVRPQQSAETDRLWWRFWATRRRSSASAASGAGSGSSRRTPIMRRSMPLRQSFWAW